MDFSRLQVMFVAEEKVVDAVEVKCGQIGKQGGGVVSSLRTVRIPDPALFVPYLSRMIGPGGTGHDNQKAYKHETTHEDSKSAVFVWSFKDLYHFISGLTLIIIPRILSSGYPIEKGRNCRALTKTPVSCAGPSFMGTPCSACSACLTRVVQRGALYDVTCGGLCWNSAVQCNPVQYSCH